VNSARSVLLVALLAAAVNSAASDYAVDRLKLESSVITGNRELPKVMSIVPWKAPEPPDGPARPMGSQIAEVLSPLDQVEFRREITYFRDLSSHISHDRQAGPPADTASPSMPSQSSSSPGASEP
jgi:hypothetical protein